MAYKYWTNADIERAKNLVAQGMCGRDIAVELRRSPDCLYNKLRSLGLKAARPLGLGDGERCRTVQNAKIIDARGEQAKRTCLTCGNTFNSEHRGNRMCPPCAGNLDQGGSGYDQVAVPGRPASGRRVSHHAGAM